ncbi:MAG: LVIVD repeat-containing protein [Actinomycetota bacterium]
MRLIRLVLSLAPLLSLIAAPAVRAEEGTRSPNMTHVVNLPHRAGSVDGPPAGGGTDIEFVDLTVLKRGPDGSIACKGPRAESRPKCLETRSFALAGSYDNGLQIVDVTDPTRPATAAVYDCVVRQGDVQVFARDGRTYVTYTHDDPYQAGTGSTCYREAEALGLFGPGVNPAGTFVVDITDPYAPTTASFLSELRGSHNQTVAPGGRYLYNSNSDLTRFPATIEVFDIADLQEPRKVFTLDLGPGLNSHDITFNEDGTRAYSAALTHTLVLDTTNLAQPRIIGRIVDPAINIHHQSDPVTLTDETTGLTRTFLVVTDELAGAAGNAVCPGGGLHVYDVTGPLETAPVKVGYWNMPDVRFTGTANLTCTSHVLRMYPDDQMMTIAWYNAGVRVVDISGLVGASVGIDETLGNVGPGMREVGFHYFPDSDTWSAKINRIEADGSFYVFGNDLNRGLDVYRFDGQAAASTSGGTWLPGTSAPPTTGTGDGGPYCLYRGLEVG